MVNMMDTKTQRKTNPVLRDTVNACEEAARTNDAPIWSDVAEALKKANRKQTEVTLSHVLRNTEDGETVVVPGKVMGTGRFDKDVTVAAFDFTRSALESINEAGETKYIDELVEENPDGSNVKIVR